MVFRAMTDKEWGENFNTGLENRICQSRVHKL